ncbi:MAG: MBL fold metallo-hydrolase [Bacteroidia bacterium]|nr:MBL fold metallo-hydrolase [Bacteroidia bacterium]NNK72566.1 MBL fold metallo-hydrolase [Flavobacteriaceae bacterium]
MALKENTPYFVKEKDIVLRIKPEEKTSKNAVNHLILGDYMRYLGEKNGDWIKVRSRNCTGWIKKDWITEKRLLEINFVDIGQGDGCHIVTPDDEMILIDAGEGIGLDGKGADNMARFINWRYNLRRRLVAGVEGSTANTPKVKPPLDIDYAIITHPDLDHYFGFYTIFNNKKLKVKKICHNGIVERSTKGIDQKTWMYDLGKKVPPLPKKKQYHLWDTVLTNKEMKDLIKANLNSQKYYLKTLVKAYENNKSCEFEFIERSKEFLDHFKGNNAVKLKVLAPITEEVEFEGKKRACLKKIGNEGETKNGHSLVFKLEFGKVKILLGGDLNSKSQDYIAQYYSGETTTLSELEKGIAKIEEKLSHPQGLSTAKKDQLKQDLDEKVKLMDLIISKTRRVFHADIAKACHHGASDVLNSFLQTINPIATIISSGDNESHSHPRPDALGAFGKTSRGKRPLLFSTELARSTFEFSYPIKFYSLLKKLEKRMNEATTKKEKEHYQLRMNNMKDSNVAKYGMITIRTDGHKVIIAQKLEQERSPGQKWDIYELHWNEFLEKYEYRTSGSH